MPSSDPSTSHQSMAPSHEPSKAKPSSGPSQMPSSEPSTSYPLMMPSHEPRKAEPSSGPSQMPSSKPSMSHPSRTPSHEPSKAEPSSGPSQMPSSKPSTSVPSMTQSQQPSSAPTPRRATSSSILPNWDLEEPTIDSWIKNSGSTIEQSAEHVHSGNFGGLVTGRETKWEGVAQQVAGSIWSSSFPTDTWMAINTTHTLMSTNLQKYPLVSLILYFETVDHIFDFLVDEFPWTQKL
jgi:hypothetical protein